jgi:hypothetical protein
MKKKSENVKHFFAIFIDIFENMRRNVKFFHSTTLRFCYGACHAIIADFGNLRGEIRPGGCVLFTKCF